jgi:hypothetical protein
MQRNRRTSIIVAGGALAVASIGYGLGTQADDGTALAGGGSDRGGARGVACEHGPPPGFSNLADTLGVDADKLGDALRDFHDQEHTERRDEFATKLAGALDLPAERVTAALEKVHDRLEPRFERRGERGDAGPAERPRIRHAWLPLRQLASELDVTRAELRKALSDVRPDRADIEDRFKQHQQELAEFLAERFDLDVEKVTDALADLPRPAPPPHDGRPGPGGPGAFGPAH